jgi:hypothetical protein
MTTRRTLLGATAGAGLLTLLPLSPAAASAGGWPVEAGTITTFRIAGSRASVALRRGEPAAVLLHVARRWHYEIAALDTGEGGGVTGGPTGTSLALHPTAYPAGGSERLWPHHEMIVRDILLDCEGTVVWGGDLTPVAASHFHLAAGPGDSTLARVAARLDTTAQAASRRQTAGRVADPALPDRLRKARALPRPR